MILKQVCYSEELENVDLNQEVSQELASKIEALWGAWDKMEEENDVNKDGTVALYGTWDYPYNVFRREASRLEDELKHIYGMCCPFLG